MMKSAPMRKAHDEMNSSDVEEEELEFAAMEEGMSLLSFSTEGLSKGDDDDDGNKSVDLAGFFSDDEETCETMTDTEDVMGDDESDCFKSIRSDSFKSNSGHGGKLWKRRCSYDALHKKVKQPSNASATGVCVVSGYSSPSSGNTSPTQPIDIVYGSHTDFSGKKTYHASRRTKSRRNLFKAREDWREKVWERKRDQVLSEELISFTDNNYSDSQSSKTAHDSGEEGKNISPVPGTNKARSFTNVDLDELKGFLDLGFGFNYEEIPELSNTLPALELCYVMGQKLQDDNNHHKSSPVYNLDNADSPKSDSHAQSPIANWKISRPGDHPQLVKERLKVWAQAVACTVRLCST